MSAGGLTFDAGALIALERGDRRVTTLVARSAERGWSVTVPAPALAQVVRRPARQVRLARFLRQPTTEVVGLGRADAVVTSDGDDLGRVDPTVTVVAL